MEINLQTLLTFAFLAWAGVVGFLGKGIRTDLKDIAKTMQKYVLVTEKRLTRIETRLGIGDGSDTEDFTSE